MKKNKMLISATAALVLPIANATDPPELREGLWVDSHASDRQARKQKERVDKNALPQSRVQGGKISSEMHCVMAGTAIDTKGTETYGGDTSTHSETHTTYSPALGGVSESTTISIGSISVVARREPSPATRPTPTA